MKPSTLQALTLYLDDAIEFKNFMEFLALFTGLKPVVRLTGSPASLTVIEEAMRPFVGDIERSPLGLVKVYANDLSDAFYKVVSGSPDEFDLMVTYVGEPDRVAEAIHAETTGCDDEETARTLGYPVCCARNYAAIKAGEHWINSYIGSSRELTIAPWQANKIAYLFAPGLTLLPDYFPCSVSCRSSWQLARAYHETLCAQKLPEIESAVNAHLTGVAIVAAGEILYAPNYALAGQGWIELRAPGYRLRFNHGGPGLPQDISSVKVLPGRVMVKSDDVGGAESEIACGEGEGGILFS